MLNRRIVRSGLIAAAAAALTMASMAGGALKTKSASTTIGASPDAGAATAKCKKGSEAVSGGFDNPDFDPDFSPVTPGAAIFNITSAREGKRKWSATGENSGTDPGELIAYAYCDKKEPGLKRKSKTVTIDGNATDSATAKCPKGSVAVSGGYGSEDLLPGFNPLASKRDGKRKWTVRAYNFDFPASAELTVFVYCDKSEPKIKTKSAQTEVIESEAGTATAKCKRGSEAVAGGFDTPNGDPTVPISPAIYPYESRRTGKREWTGSGWNDEEDGTFVVYAYCKKK
jgi:hypothetical protein